ncbi:MAG: thioredoxin-disulfide reductase [Patescibacteria group bacterium]|nr:thioredoxin-disulfide reductase [Patescibacteria group bacterium]MBU2509515.1 thioredoxin-disulfide reductase [Patescibacteria group bacterium]
MSHKLIIIGSGPAGWTAAIYAARAELQPIVFEGEQPGGQLITTTEVENFPGFPEGIQGPELMEKMKEQAKRFNTEIISESVETVDFSSRPFKVVSKGKTYECESVIIATGATARRLGLESEEKLIGHGVSYCATCDGFFFKNKNVVVIGGGDGAMEEATFLTRFANKVTIVHRKDAFTASKIMQERVKKNPKIDIIWNSEVIEILGVDQNKVTGIKVKDTKTNVESEIQTDGVFAAIGHVPNTKIFKDQIDINEKGYIVTQPDSTKTNIECVFAAGDVQDWKWRQAVSAAGSGCIAAIEAERALSEQEDNKS